MTQPITENEIKRLLNIDDLRDRLFIKILFYGVRRAGEVRGLRWKDVIKDGEVKKTIRFKLLKKKKKLKEKTIGKEEFRDVPTDMFKDDLQEWYRVQQYVDPEFHVFYARTRYGRRSARNPMTKDGVNLMLKKYMQDIDTEVKSSHVLRKTGATLTYNKLCENPETKPIALFIIQGMLGHKDPASTVKYLGIDEKKIYEGFGQLNSIA